VELNFTVVEAGATLSDPFFAFGVVAACLGCTLAAFVAVFFWHHPRASLGVAALSAAILTPLMMLFAGGMISATANLAIAVLHDANVTVHYWGKTRYIWPCWAGAVIGLVVGGFARAKWGYSGKIQPAEPAS
jgi:hypothetical protein